MYIIHLSDVLTQDFVVLVFSLVCKIRSGASELSKSLNITVEVHEGKVEGRFSIDGKADMAGFTFVVILVVILIALVKLHFLY